MIKFRCLNCNQKIAVDDAGANLVVCCPTCGESLVIPPETALEFRAPATLLPLELLADTMAPEAADGGAAVRQALAPYLAQLLQDRLVQELIAQRRRLMESHQNGIEVVGEIEKRLAKLHADYQARLTANDRRIVDLQQEITRKEAELQRLRPAAPSTPVREKHHTLAAV